MSNISAKFRPSLTSAQIEYLIRNLQSAAVCPERDDILKQLHKFHLKAVHGIISPSHVSAPRASLIDQLGFGDTVKESDDVLVLLETYRTNPSVLSVAQLSRVQHHRYLNDMMTAEEEAAHEATQV